MKEKKTLDPTTLLQQTLQSNTMHIRLQTNKKAWVWTWNNQEQQQWSCYIMIESCGPPMIASALLLLSPSLCLAFSHSILLASITPIQEILEQSPMKNSHHSSPLIPSFVSFSFSSFLQPTQPTPKIPCQVTHPSVCPKRSDFERRNKKCQFWSLLLLWFLLKCGIFHISDL